MSPLILAIETSCDETAIAITKGNHLLSNIVSSQVALHQKYGGVMPELASRLHVETITIVLREALEKAKVSLDEIDAIAVTRGPGLIGALHVGLQTAKTLSALYKKPLIPVHHLAGHIYANEFVAALRFPLLAIIVSGGNTEFVYMKEHLHFQIVGQTRDDAIGECYDKVARVLGLPYPGGQPIDNLAKTGIASYRLPTPTAPDFDVSYSGLKTAVINLVNNAKQRGEQIEIADLCASFQKTAVNMIVEKTSKAAQHFKVKQIVLAGGVSANSLLRSRISELGKEQNIEVIIPPLWATTDNAAMIAILANRLLDKGLIAPLDIGVNPSWSIEQYDDFSSP